MTLPVAILAGGLATRLRPLTEKIPKALVEVSDEPFVNHQLRLLAQNGIKRVVFCIGYLGDQIIDAVGDGSRFGVEASFIVDGPKLLGTAGALRNALHMLGDEFFVLYGDSYLDCDYRAIEVAWKDSGKSALMTVFRNEGQFDSSNVEFANGEIIKYSKRERTPRMNHIDYGLSVLSSAALLSTRDGTPADLAEIFEELSARGQLAAYEVKQRFYEIGSFAGIADLEAYLERATS